MSSKINLATLHALDVDLSYLYLNDSGRDLVWKRGFALHDAVGEFGHPEIL